MANVEHSTLTGADLHEPKGIAAAIADRVYVSNGSGSGSWTTVPDAAISDAAKIFSKQYVTLSDTVGSGTSGGGSLTSSSWNTRRLNTKTIDWLGISLSSNQFTLPAGQYIVMGWSRSLATQDLGAGGVCQGTAELRLYNVTDGVTVVNGGGWTYLGDSGAGGTVNDNIYLPILGWFNIGGTKTFALQQWVRNISSCTFTAGSAVSSGDNEKYSELIIWKVA